MGGNDPWREGNRVALLENGEAFFARAFAAIAQAREEVLLETFILFEDKVGWELHRQLTAAARRGVRVEVMVDGYGSPRFSPSFLDGLAETGVILRVFDPHRTLLGLRLHIFRRLHRKLLVVDGTRAFVGGINYSADHLEDFGPTSKQDYAVELQGPVVDDIRTFAAAAMRGNAESWRHPPSAATAHAGNGRVLFALRDNAARSTEIERQYRIAIRAARDEIVIATANASARPASITAVGTRCSRCTRELMPGTRASMAWATDGARHNPIRRRRLVSGDSTNESITASVMGTRTSWAR